MQHERRTEHKLSGNAGSRCGGRTPEFLSFAVIQERAQGILDDIRENVAEHVLIPAGREEEMQNILASRFAEVEKAGVRTVVKLRQRRGDGDALAVRDWEALARRAMIRKLVSLFEGDQPNDRSADDEDGEQSGAGLPAGPGPVGPRPDLSGGIACLPARDSEDNHLSVAHPLYLRTTEDVGRVVFGYALSAVRWRVGSWSDDSEELDAIAASAAVKVLSRYQRLWDPSVSSLLAYLNLSVRYAVHDEYVSACKRKSNGKALIEAYERVLREEMRVRAGSAEQDLRVDGLAEELELQEYAGRLRLHVRRLNPHQRCEVERRLLEGTPGTPAEQSTFSRAVSSLRRRVA